MTAPGPQSGRTLIVNADDFGLCEAVNRGIIAAHQRGIVTSTSLMVRPAAAALAAKLAADHPSLGIGLHIDLGEWCYDPAKSEWVAAYHVVDTADPAAVHDEIHRQLDRFRVLIGRDPDHIDSHQHVHREPPALNVARELARRLGVPLRHHGPIHYRGGFYGQGPGGEPLPELITAIALRSQIQSLPAGVSELCCHPGEDPGPITTYRHERPVELAALIDPACRQAIVDGGVRLCRFTNLR